MKRKNIHNWLSGLRYRFSDFGLNTYSLSPSFESKEKKNWLIENGIRYIKNESDKPKGIAHGYNRCIKESKT